MAGEALLPDDSITDLGNATAPWNKAVVTTLQTTGTITDGTHALTVAELRTHLDTPVSTDLSGCMKLAVYDPDGDGKVAAADTATTAGSATTAASADTATVALKLQGVGSAGAQKYYGTNAAGDAGFHALPSGTLPAAHATTHAASGNDPLTPAAIGAAASEHVHGISGVTGLQFALEAKAETGHTHNPATVSAAGFFTAADKEKLDGIAPGAQANTVTSVNGQTGDVLLVTGGVTLGETAPVMDGVASAGSLAYAAHADHVHPADTGRAAAAHTHVQDEVAGLTADLAAKAPLSHATADTTCGEASDTRYGHVRLATAAALNNGSAAAGTSSRAAREDHVHAGGIFLEQVEVTVSGTLTKNKMNIITSASALTLTMPGLNAGEGIGIFPLTSGHTINYDGIRSFWQPQSGTATTSFTIASTECAMRVLHAFGTAYVGGLN